MITAIASVNLQLQVIVLMYFQLFQSIELKPGEGIAPIDGTFVHLCCLSFSSRLSPDVDKDNGAVIDSDEGERLLTSSEKGQNRKRKHHSSDKHKHRRKSKKKHKHRSERKRKKKRRSSSESDSSSSESDVQKH